MKAAIFAVSLLALSSPAFAAITLNQARQEAANCIYHSARANGLYVSRPHAFYLAKEAPDFFEGSVGPVYISPRQRIAVNCASQVLPEIKWEQMEIAARKTPEGKAKIIAREEAFMAMNQRLINAHNRAYGKQSPSGIKTPPGR